MKEITDRLYPKRCGKGVRGVENEKFAGFDPTLQLYSDSYANRDNPHRLVCDRS
jgi:hypothetical protein